MHICVCVCVYVCVHYVAAWLEPCASKEQVWGGSPALPVAHLRGRLCAACALSVPTPHRAGEPGGEKGVRRGERGLKGINHGREKRAGGGRMEGSGLLPMCAPLFSPSALFLLSLPMLMSCDVQGEIGREEGRGRHMGGWREASLITTPLILRVEACKL